MTGNNRIIGGYDRDSTDRATAIYRTFVRGQIYQTDARTAEFVKLMENTCRDVNIALANEFAQLAEECRINVWEAITLANKHPPRVTVLNPPGPGVGGHCIAVDPPWFLTENSTRCRMVSTAREINDSMPNYVLHIARGLLAGIRIRRSASSASPTRATSAIPGRARRSSSSSSPRTKDMPSGATTRMRRSSRILSWTSQKRPQGATVSSFSPITTASGDSIRQRSR